MEHRGSMPNWIWMVIVICACYCASDVAGKESVSECSHDKKVPYRAVVNDDGTVQISCRFVDCVNASKENIQCEKNFHAHSCNKFPQWLHGVRQPNAGKGPLQTKCCNYDRLLYATYKGTTVLHRRQGFLGGFAYIRGQENTNKRDGFDVITNMTKEGDGYRIWVYRLRCIPPPPKQQQPTKSQQYYDTNPRLSNPSIDYQNVQVRDQNGNVQTVPVVYSSGGCFSPDTTVYSKNRGSITIDQLKVGEEVLTIHGKTSAYRPVSFFLHRDPGFTARYLTLHTEKPGVSVTMTPYHITFSDKCTSTKSYPQKFANEVRPGECLMLLDRETGRVENIRVTNITESYRKGIYSPITPNGVIITNDLVSSCYSFIKNQDLQASIFYYMALVEEFLHRYFAMPMGWLLGGQQTKVDVPRGLDYILSALNHIMPICKLI